jgi:hypothetical protein
MAVARNIAELESADVMVEPLKRMVELAKSIDRAPQPVSSARARLVKDL